MPAELERKQANQPGTETLEALTCLAHFGGSFTRASAELDIPTSTLFDWKAKYPDVYTGIAQRLAGQTIARTTTESRELTLNAFKAASESVDEYRTKLEAKEIKDPAGGGLRMATIGGIAYDKTALADSRPTSINVQVSPKELVESLRKRLSHAPESVKDEGLPQ